MFVGGMLALHLPFNFSNSYIALFNDLVLTLFTYDSIIQPISLLYILSNWEVICWCHTMPTLDIYDYDKYD